MEQLTANANPTQSKGTTIAALIRQLKGKVPQPILRQVRKRWAGRSFDLGTFCSGTDVCVDVNRQVLESFDVKVRHVFSCDKATHVQEYIRRRCRPTEASFRLFDDITDIPSLKAFDVLSNRATSVPPSHFVYIGFSCKDVSHLNVHAGASRGCVKSGTLRTGHTLRCSIEYVRVYRPYLVGLENVAALDDCDAAGNSNADDLVEAFEELGYIVVRAVVNSRSHGALQRRTRWWGIAWLVSSTGPIQESQRQKYAASEAVFFAVLSCIELDPRPMSSVMLTGKKLDAWKTFRLGLRSTLAPAQADDEDSEDELEKKKKQELRDWPQLHAEFFRSAGHRYPPVLEFLYTPAESKVLSTEFTRRCQEIVAFSDLDRGRVREGEPEQVIDVSQSINRTPRMTDGLPCITPTGLFWMRKAFRRLEPIECLAAQGVPLCDVEDMSFLSPGDIQSLAGNAFNAHSVAAFTLSAMVAFGPPGVDGACDIDFSR